MGHHKVSTLLFLCTLLSVIVGSSVSFAGGLDFGFGGGGEPEEGSCTAESDFVITPGPINSPVRLTQLDADKILVADYTRYAIKEVAKEDLGAPDTFFDTRLKLKDWRGELDGNTGKPLSLLRRKLGRSSVYYVGNDDRKTIDLYWKRNDKVFLFKRLFEEEGVQALDMVRVSGRIFIVDGQRKRVLVMKLRGKLRGEIGGEGQLLDPKGIAFDKKSKEIYVTDYGDPLTGVSASIQVFSTKGEFKRKITGNFSRPQGIDVAGGKIYVADAMLGQILEFDRDTGDYLKSHGCFGTSEGRLLLPMDVVVDKKKQVLYVADNRNGRVTALSLLEQP